MYLIFSIIAFDITDPLLSRYPGSEYSVGIRRVCWLLRAHMHGESSGYDFMCVDSGLKRMFNVEMLESVASEVLTRSPVTDSCRVRKGCDNI